MNIKIIGSGLAALALGVSAASAGAVDAEVAASSPTLPASAASLRRFPRLAADDVRCRPQYPMEAVRAGAQGVTTVEFTFGADGALLGTRIVRSAGASHEHKLLDEATVSGLSRCPYRPATDESGQPVRALITVAYTWLLD